MTTQDMDPKDWPLPIIHKDSETLQNEMEEYMNSVKRYLKLQPGRYLPYIPADEADTPFIVEGT